MISLDPFPLDKSVSLTSYYAQKNIYRATRRYFKWAFVTCTMRHTGEFRRRRMAKQSGVC